MTKQTRPDDILSRQAQADPRGIAYRMLGSGQAVTWQSLEQRSRQCAAMLLAQGLRSGDGIAVFLDNHLRYFEILWAAHRIGLYYTTVSRHLKAVEVLHIVNDCDAKTLFTSLSVLGAADELIEGTAHLHRLSLDGAAPGFDDYETALQAISPTAVLPDTPEGTDFSYSSGTTGMPKGIKRELTTANHHFVAAPGERTPGKTLTAARSTCRPRRSITPPRCAGT